jgi:hypothetical protein
MMTTDDLRKNLIHLVNTYVGDPLVSARLLELAKRDPIPVKGILSELDLFLTGRASPRDMDLIKSIAFHYC